MSVETPDTATQVEDRIKADVQRSAPDSNPYLAVHWLRSLIAGIARRIFDFYRDLNRTEQRLFPDSATGDAALRWGNIFIGPPNAATNSSGQLVATGNVGGTIGVGVSLVAGGLEYVTTTGAAIADQVVPVLSINRSGTTATVITDGDHGLSSFVPVSISGADQPEYNLTDTAIVVTGLDSFTYTVAGSPATPATGSLQSEFTTANVQVDSVDFGADTNLDVDTAVALQSPVVDVDDTLHVTFTAVGGGSDEETPSDYQGRYLDKIRNPVANFNVAAIEDTALSVTGVTRVFVQQAGTDTGAFSLSSITRSGTVATAVSPEPHGLVDGQRTSINGALEPEYNVTGAAVIVQDANTFHYVVAGSPSSPATGTLTATSTVTPGQVITYFMRDLDPDPIPSPSEVAEVKSAIDAIVPANTSLDDNFVLAPVAAPVAFNFTELVPNTSTMRTAIENNLIQFFEERTDVGADIDEDAYRAAIKNTVDPDTGDIVLTFEVSAPVGDVEIDTGQIGTLGGISYAV